MTAILLKNTEGINVGVTILGENALVINEGPDGAFTGDDNQFNICLSPRIVLDSDSTQVSKTGEMTLIGSFVIELNGTIIPLIFEANELPVYFNNASATKIVFEQTQPDKYTVENLDTLGHKEIRIIPVTKTYTIIPSPELIPLDGFNVSYGVYLQAKT